MSQAQSAIGRSPRRAQRLVSEFQRAEAGCASKEASTDFNRGEYTNAAQKFLAARDLLSSNRGPLINSAEAASQQRAQSRTSRRRREAQARDAPRGSRASRRHANGLESRLRRVRARRQRRQPSSPPISALISEEAASKEARRAIRGFAPAAETRSYETAASYLEAARQRVHERPQRRDASNNSNSARRRHHRRRPPPPAPATTLGTPTSCPRRSRGIRQVARRRTSAPSRAENIESVSTDQTEPDRPTRPKRLQDSFDALDGHAASRSTLDIHRASQIDTEIASTVNVQRRDIIIDPRALVKTVNTRAQSRFTLSKSGGTMGHRPNELGLSVPGDYSTSKQIILRCH